MSNRKKTSEKRALQTRSAIAASSALPFGVPAGVALIAIAVFLAYLPSINGGFVLDDDNLLTENKLVAASDGLYRFWCTAESQDYWPVSNTTLWIEWRLWGMNPTGYHVTNLILHIVEALLIWVILRKLSIPGAFLAAVLFAVHPVNVESVAWIAQRKNMMAMLFFLLSILYYLKMEIPSPSTQNGLYQVPSPFATRPSPLFYWLSLAAFVLAMLSKGSVTVLPVLLLGIVWWLRPLTRLDLARTAPFFVVAVVLAGVNIWFQTHGKDIEIRPAGFAERLLGAGGTVWFYLYKAIFPVDLAFVYPQWHVKTDNPLWWLPLSAVLVMTAVLWRYRKSWSRPLLFAWGFFCVALVPVMGFADVGFMQFSLVADHYQHIAIIGAIALAAALCSIWQIQTRGGSRRAATVVAITAVGVLMLLTWRQSSKYRDPITLYRAALEKNSDCWMPHYNLAVDLAKAGRPQEAIAHYQQTLLLKPNSVNALYNLGNTLLKNGRAKEAIGHYEQALRFRPDFPEAYNNLGNALININRLQEAIDYIRQALRLKPDYPEAYYNYGNALVKQGQAPAAIEYYRQSIRLKPDYFQAHYNLGLILTNAGRPDDAIGHFEQALRLKPDEPAFHNDLGIALAQADRPQEAIVHFIQAIGLKSDYLDAYRNLALAYAHTNRSDQANATARKALEIARSQGQKAETKQIEDWLNTYNAGLSDRPAKSSPSQSALPPP